MTAGTAASARVNVLTGGSPSAVVNSAFNGPGAVRVNSGSGLASDVQTISVGLSEYPLSILDRRVEALLNFGVSTDLVRDVFTLYTYSINVDPRPDWDFQFFTDMPSPSLAEMAIDLKLVSTNIFSFDEANSIFSDEARAALEQSRTFGGVFPAMFSRIHTRNSITGLEVFHAAPTRTKIETPRVGIFNRLLVVDSGGLHYPRLDPTGLPWSVGVGGVQGSANAFFPGIA